MSWKARRLEEWIRRNPHLADVPMIVVRNFALTPREALAYLKRGMFADLIIPKLRERGIDPAGGELWVLAEEYYRRLSKARPGMVINVLGVGSFTVEEVVELLRRRDPRVEPLVEDYARLIGAAR